ncbi:hypothetical protein [Halorubrum sp. BV1]|uniref:DUF7504 family protein n=1 Tax=Halorubrum sp. BV1 TaxID=1498500 RepID=UPI00067984AB|nr:hypothetical protein [Halorubrum sp. BV1]
MSDPGSNDIESETDTADSRTDRPSRFRSLRARLGDLAGTSPSDDAQGDPSGVSGREPSLDSNGGTGPDGSPDPNRNPERIDGDETTAVDDSPARHDRRDSTSGADEWEWSTAAVDADSDTGGDGGGIEARESTDPIDTDTQPTGTDTSSHEQAGDHTGRVWDRVDEAGASADSGPPGSNDTGGGKRRLPVDITPGTSVLVQAEVQNDHAERSCDELLGLSGSGAAPRVLLVRYQELDPDRLAQIAEGADRFTLIAVGYAQSVPASVDDAVDTVRVTNPKDITRLGIVVSGTIEDWADDDRPIAFCLDSLNVVLNYRGVKSTFRFLHVLLNTLHSGGAVSHFHADPTAENRQDLNTLEPLFDDVVAVDSDGVHAE